MCLPRFPSRREHPQIPLSDQANRSPRRPPTRRGNPQGAPVPHAARQPTVTAVPPDLEQDTDLASSSAFAAQNTDSPPRALRRQEGRKVSRMAPVEENVTTFPVSSPLRGDLRTLPSVRRANQDSRPTTSSGDSGPQPPSRSSNLQPAPITGTLTSKFSSSSSGLDTNAQVAASGPLASKMSWSSSSGQGEPSNAGTSRAGRLASGAQALPASYFSDSSTSGEEAADTATLRPSSANTQIPARTGGGGSGSPSTSSTSSG
ncbi:hypothetical protein PRZ48_004367 [Zasmidium cellare]|uniref:Uncharacterized protein n=1 Tax=Zasmidium cellare TaxID=395010 RepID=A0ABR0EPP5_ZASCE|nr:hypothetical protein PRZ48_004367 [Zasmidium cellare]